MMKRVLAGVSVAAGIAALSACAPKAVVAPPPVAVTQIPQRPYPPMGAAPNLRTPPVGLDGTRLTVNSNLSPLQTAWNLRSAYNVAALNCQKPQHAALVGNYGDFLKAHKRALASINSELDKQFKARYGRSSIKEREALQTQIYNYFALPPVTPSFCDAALAVGQELRSVPVGQLESYAPTGLAKIETVFQEFFASYDQYQADLKAWEARYGNYGANTARVSGPTAFGGSPHSMAQ